jgi:hypothetical protein
MNREYLTRHGFLDVEIRRDMSNICDLLPSATQVARLGRPILIEGNEWHYLDRSLTQDDLFVGWYLPTIEPFAVGSYGRIYKAYRSIIRRQVDLSSGEETFVTASPDAVEVILKKTCPTKGRKLLTLEEIKAHTSEALLHVLAWNVMQHTATPWAVPRPYEVFGEAYLPDPSGAGLVLTGDDLTLTPANRWLSMALCMNFVQGRTLHQFFEKYWTRANLRLNAVCFLEIVAQTAFILYQLQRYLRLNHRDVKVNNVLIRRRATPVELTLGSATLHTGFEITLIDFGFACVGCPPPRAPVSTFHASSYFTPHEMCCKVGRDLAQLIFCIHCYFPLHEFLPRDLFREVRNWMLIAWNGGLADSLHGFTKDGKPRPIGAPGPPEYHHGIYEFLRRADVDPTLCEPVTLFAACCQLKSRYI